MDIGKCKLQYPIIVGILIRRCKLLFPECAHLLGAHKRLHLSNNDRERGAGCAQTRISGRCRPPKAQLQHGHIVGCGISAGPFLQSPETVLSLINSIHSQKPSTKSILVPCGKMYPMSIIIAKRPATDTCLLTLLHSMDRGSQELNAARRPRRIIPTSSLRVEKVAISGPHRDGWPIDVHRKQRSV